MKLLLPWLCVAVLLAGLGWVYSSGQKKDAELELLRQDSQQLQKLRTEQEEAKATRTQAESDELARLRREHEELLRLRNEMGQLRREKQQLSTQMQNAQVQAQNAQEQMQALKAHAAQTATAQTATPQTPEAAARAAFEKRYGLAPQTPEQVQINTCINNLRLIDGAKQQWALEHKKGPGALMTASDLAPYLKSNTLPTCPAGGIYTLNPVNVAPICSIPGHAIPR